MALEGFGSQGESFGLADVEPAVGCRWLVACYDMASASFDVEWHDRESLAPLSVRLEHRENPGRNHMHAAECATLML